MTAAIPITQTRQIRVALILVLAAAALVPCRVVRADVRIPFTCRDAAPGAEDLEAEYFQALRAEALTMTAAQRAEIDDYRDRYQALIGADLDAEVPGYVVNEAMTLGFVARARQAFAEAHETWGPMQYEVFASQNRIWDQLHSAHDRIDEHDRYPDFRPAFVAEGSREEEAILAELRWLRQFHFIVVARDPQTGHFRDFETGEDLGIALGPDETGPLSVAPHFLDLDADIRAALNGTIPRCQLEHSRLTQIEVAYKDDVAALDELERFARASSPILNVSVDGSDMATIMRRSNLSYEDFRDAMLAALGVVERNLDIVETRLMCSGARFTSAQWHACQALWTGCADGSVNDEEICGAATDHLGAKDLMMADAVRAAVLDTTAGAYHDVDCILRATLGWEDVLRIGAYLAGAVVGIGLSLIFGPEALITSLGTVAYLAGVGTVDTLARNHEYREARRWRESGVSSGLYEQSAVDRAAAQLLFTAVSTATSYARLVRLLVRAGPLLRAAAVRLLTPRSAAVEAERRIGYYLVEPGQQQSQTWRLGLALDARETASGYAENLSFDHYVMRYGSVEQTVVQSEIPADLVEQYSSHLDQMLRTLTAQRQTMMGVVRSGGRYFVRYAAFDESIPLGPGEQLLVLGQPDHYGGLLRIPVVLEGSPAQGFQVVGGDLFQLVSQQAPSIRIVLPNAVVTAPVPLGEAIQVWTSGGEVSVSLVTGALGVP